MVRICVLGTGHVGLVYSVALALDGHEVCGADVDAKVISSLSRGQPTFFEPGLAETLADAIGTGRLSFSTDILESALRADVIFLAVGTPSRRDGSIDLAYLRAAAREVGRAMRRASRYQVVVVKSTVIPGTTEDVVRPLLERASGKKAGKGFGLCVNPEFLREGSAVQDALHPDRLVIGALDSRSLEALDAVYARQVCPRLATDLRTAEMVKYATNAFLATKVSFANELANLCDALGSINVDTVVEGMGLDPRINPKFLKAGLGFGGSCFPKDVRALVAAGTHRKYRARLLKAALSLNDVQPLRAVGLAEKALGSLRARRVVILGLAFKGGSDDVRESRAIPLARALLRKGANVVGFDPAANDAFHKVVPRVEIAQDLASALDGADVCIIQNDWPQWRELRAVDFMGMRRGIVIDGRRIVNRETMGAVTLVVLGG